MNRTLISALTLITLLWSFTYSVAYTVFHPESIAVTALDSDSTDTSDDDDASKKEENGKTGFKLYVLLPESAHALRTNSKRLALISLFTPVGPSFAPPLRPPSRTTV